MEQRQPGQQRASLSLLARAHPADAVTHLGSLAGDPLKDVIDERVEDRHCLVGDSGVWVDLLEDLVDVGRVRLHSLLVLLLLLPALGLDLGRLLGRFRRGLFRESEMGESVDGQEGVEDDARELSSCAGELGRVRGRRSERTRTDLARDGHSRLLVRRLLG